MNFINNYFRINNNYYQIIEEVLIIQYKLKLLSDYLRFKQDF